MSANPTTIAAGYQTALGTISGLQTYAYAPDKPEPPCGFAVPHRNPFLTRETMQMGVVSTYWDVYVFVSNVVDDQAQSQLNAYALSSGTGSVWAALEADKTLGGAVANSTVQNLSEYGLIEWNDLRYLGAVWLCRALSTG